MRLSFKLVITLVACLFIAACNTKAKTALQQQKLNYVSADSLNTQQFALKMLEMLQNSNVNSVVSIKAHEGKPIVIDAASFDVRQPVDLEAIFNSAAFQRDYGAMFPPTKNGWDAFIAFLGTIESVAGSPVPWLAGALNTAFKRGSVNFTGDGNSVATEGSRIINDSSDNSDRSDNSRVDQSDRSTTFGESTPEGEFEGEGG